MMTPSCYSSALTCGVCLDEFRDPRALPCLHTFCLDCLVRLHQRGGSVGGRLVCPCCRRVCQTPAAGPESLPRNFHVARLREMRPLMQMGQGLAEEFSERATREIARLPSEAQLRADVADCRRRLAELRASQRGIAEFLDAIEEAVRDEREAIGEAFAEAKAQIKAKRRRARDNLARRSVSERLLDCAKSDRHQLVLDLIGEFRATCANNRTDSASSSGDTSSRSLTVTSPSSWTPTEAQVRRRIRSRLVQISSSNLKEASSGSVGGSGSSRQCSRKRRKLRQKKQKQLQLQHQVAKKSNKQQQGSSGAPTRSSIKRRKRAESTGSSTSRLMDDSEIEELCREYGLAGYVIYES